MTRSESEKVIQAFNITKIYSSGDQRVRAINGLTLDIERKTFVAVTGASGSGKTTLLNLLAGLDKPTSGNILLKGQDLTRMTEKELTNVRRFDIGIIFQFYYMHEGLTALQNIEYPMLIAGVKRAERKKRAVELLDFVGMTERSGFLPRELSGGEKQRIGIARSLVNDPGVIFADEPTGDLDTHTAGEILGYFWQLVNEKDKTIVVVTHDLEILAPKMRVLTLVDGKIATDN